MQPVITIFKTEFLGYYRLCQQLGVVPTELKECEFYYTYTPAPERLPEIVKVLRQNRVIHGVHFENRKSYENKAERNFHRNEFIRA